MLRRVPKALKVGFRAGFNSFVVALKPTQRSMTFMSAKMPVHTKKRKLQSGDIWLDLGTHTTKVYEKANGWVTPVQPPF